MPLTASPLLAPELARLRALVEADPDTVARRLEALGWTETEEGVWRIGAGETDEETEELSFTANRNFLSSSAPLALATIGS